MNSLQLRGAGGVVFPAFVPLPGDDEISLADLAHCVAHDNHPGDDAVGPRFLLTTALAVVDLRALSKAVAKAGGELAITGEVARECCATYDDELQALASYALQDAGTDPPIGGCCPETAALILVCGVLMHHEAQRRA